KIYGDNVDKTRRKLGHYLAMGHPVEGADIVISVPDSSNTAALGFSHESGVQYEMALIRNHYVGRTFIEPEQRLRDFGVKIKFNPVAGVLRDKSVVVVDDSIVRGTTLKKLIRHIRNSGAAEVHVRISSPPIIRPCFYGMDFPTQDELIASSRSVPEIRKHIEADSLEYLTPEELLLSVPTDNGQGYCTACFTGNYPIKIEQ
ncbi:MAG: amidophosphoribosyltransferase, partial [Calditrichaeota bacterium]|nr:amidophosphoribosyltransferase [Calditrichota bacterium]